MTDQWVGAGCGGGYNRLPPYPSLRQLFTALPIPELFVESAEACVGTALQLFSLCPILLSSLHPLQVYLSRASSNNLLTCTSVVQSASQETQSVTDTKIKFTDLTKSLYV